VQEGDNALQAMVVSNHSVAAEDIEIPWRNATLPRMDHALRELGVGDVSVGKKMRKLGEALYGRMAIYEPALRDGDAEALAASLARNVYESEIATTGTALAAFALSSRARLAEQTLDAVVGAPAWAEIAA
jgi:cytochrome b pre-mRNA-processing protein 3